MTLFSNYQEINDLFTIDFRKLVAEDCDLNFDSNFVIDIENKIIKREIQYSIKKEYIREINEFFHLLQSKKEYIDFAKYMFNSDFLDGFNQVMTKIVLKKEAKLDFRGCKTEEDRNSKIEKSKKLVDFFDTEKLSLVDAYIDNHINSGIEAMIKYVNEKTELEVIDYLTSEQAIDNISDSTLFDLSRELKKIIIDISTLTDRKKLISEEIVKMKQNIIINRLVETNFTITDNLGNSYVLPETTIEKIKSTLQTSFSPKKYLKI